MKSKVRFYLFFTLFIVTFVLSGCRRESDDLVSYAYNDAFSFRDAKSSLEGQFRAIWTAMNCNYPIWDYEEEHGIDWDAVYDKYIGRFKELDREYNVHNPIPDSLLVVLYKDIISPLHDGHTSLYLMNIQSGKRVNECFSPQLYRSVADIASDISGGNSTILDEYYELLFEPTLKWYENNDNVMDYMEYNGFIYGLFDNNIVYLRLPSFNLTETLNTDIEMMLLWGKWINCIKKLQETNTLGGVIIDVRNNSGGYAADFQFVFGALVRGEKGNGGSYYQVGWCRKKNGVGRLDYSIPLPDVYAVSDNNLDVKDPIVVLANKYSASMSEITCLAAKQIENGYFIGTQTYGAYSTLLDVYSFSYSGSVGDPALSDTVSNTFFAPFYIRMPSIAFLSNDGDILDGSGIMPDEEVKIDWLNHIQYGQDAQLDRALEYIRSKQIE